MRVQKTGKDDNGKGIRWFQVEELKRIGLIINCLGQFGQFITWIEQRYIGSSRFAVRVQTSSKLKAIPDKVRQIKFNPIKSTAVRHLGNQVFRRTQKAHWDCSIGAAQLAAL